METSTQGHHDKRLFATHHHEFVDTPLVDSEPFQAHRLEEVSIELNANFDIWKTVNQRAEIFRQLFLNQWLI